MPVTTNSSRKEQSDNQVLGRTERLVALMRETSVGLTDRELPPFDGEKLWTVDIEPSEWENYLKGGPEPSYWNRKPKRAPIMRPPDLSRDCLSLEETLNRLERVRVSGLGRWRARCPLEHTRRDSFLIVGEHSYKPGEPVFYCYGGCTHAEVKAALLRVDG